VLRLKTMKVSVSYCMAERSRFHTSGLHPLSRKSGQAMIEYVAVAAMLIATVAILAVFLYTFREQGDRVLELVGYDYP